MKKRILQASVTLLAAIALFLCAIMEPISYVDIEDESVALSGGEGTLVQQTAADTNVIPDKYNTGASGELTKVKLGDKVEGIQFAAGGGGNKNVMDFYYRNKTIEGTVVIENYDFSDNPVCIYNAELVKRNIRLVFNNCKFGSISVCRETGYFTFEFTNCTIESFAGGCSKFDRCRFGGSINDAIVPYQDVEVNNCMISDMGGQKLESGTVHTDGTQIYGAKGIDVKNVSFYNCRFEIPPVAPEGSKAYVNACIMLQMEFSNADTVTVSDCILNGGGFAIYARTASSAYTLNNVSFKNIRVGCSGKYGSVCDSYTPGVTFDSIANTSELYVASVWKEDGNTHFSVSNDTHQERNLKIFTDKGEFDYTIPACKSGSEITSSDVYGDMPFDMDIVVPQDCAYAVCYDTTLERCASQIRYMNWSGKDIYLSDQQSEDLLSGGEDVLYEGSCGENVKFTLNKSGVLTLEGTGETYSYNSQKPAPWTEYKRYIKKINVGDGITKIGDKLFLNCPALQEVSLPDSLSYICCRSFYGCCDLNTITLPAGLKQMREYALPYTTLTTVYYKGTDWHDIELIGDHKGLEDKIVILGQDKEEPEPVESEQTEPGTEETVPEVSAPEETTPEAAKPETPAAEETTPEAAKPETPAAEETTPEVAKPDAPAVGETTPESTVTDKTETEAAEPEKNEPEVIWSKKYGKNITHSLMSDGSIHIKIYGKTIVFRLGQKIPWFYYGK